MVPRHRTHPGADQPDAPNAWLEAASLRALIGAVQEGIILQDGSGVVLSANAAAERIVGARAGMMNQTELATIHPDGSDWPSEDHPVSRCLTTGLPQRDAIMGLKKGDGISWVRVNCEPVDRGTTPADQSAAVVTTVTEVPDAAPSPAGATPPVDKPGDAGRQAAEAALRQAEERFRLAFDKAPTGNAIVSPDGRFVRVNARLAAMLGREERDLLKLRATELVRDEDREKLSGYLELVTNGEDAPRAEIRLTHRTGRPVHVSVTASWVHEANGSPAYVIAQIEDVTARKLAQAALTHQATHDALTALPNRTLLLDRLGHALERSRRNQTHVALLFCDVDRFKRINDSLGHEVGDLLLVEIARRLRTTIRGADTAGRLSGDEFLVICEDLGRPDDALKLAERVRAITDEPIQVAGHTLSVSLSIGVAHAAGDEQPANLLRRADTAMYEAKERGRGRFEVFDEALRRRARQRLELETELRHAVENNELRLHHQPVVDLIEGNVVGREALVRWQHPTRGLLNPGAFLDVAEESDLIVDLGSWVLDEACRQGFEIGRRHEGDHVAVNVSAKQLGRTDFRGRVENALANSGLRHDQLILELTETSLLKASANTLADVEALSAAGVRWAVDDFGTGYSSLTYLQKLPVRVVKIDRSFVADITTDNKRRAIAEAVISLGRALELEVIAEGVENAEQAALLADIGCRLAQGYLFGRPVPMLTDELDRSTA